MNARELREIWRRFHGRGTYPHQLAFLLELPPAGRGELQSGATIA
jgi:hypothetical protein